MTRFIIIFLAFLFLTAGASGRRTAGDVKRERQATEQRIKKTRRQISTNVEDTRRELNRLTSLEGEIRENNLDISRLTASRDSLRRIVRRLTDSVRHTHNRVEHLQQSRGASLRAARRQRQTSASATAFLFSSDSFRQAMRRASWLRDLARWQDSTATALSREARELERRRARLDSAQNVLRANLGQLNEQRTILEQNSRSAKAVVESLKKQSRNLEKVLKQQQSQAEKLDRELNRIIEEEARRAAEEARRAEEARKKKEREEAERRQREQQPNKQQQKQPSAPTAPAVRPSQPEKTTPQPVAASGKPFAEMKGRLPLPLDRNATVAVPFGVNTHAEYSKVKTVNNGIDLETTKGASARAVHEGTVSMVIVMEGYHNVVLVRHGEYLTVYAGLTDIAVRKGQHVGAGERLGTVYTDPRDNNRTRLHFEVRHEKEKLDPAQWIKLR